MISMKTMKCQTISQIIRCHHSNRLIAIVLMILEMNPTVKETMEKTVIPNAVMTMKNVIQN